MTRQKNRPQIRVTTLAHRHIEKIVAVLSASGQSISKTSLVSQIILSVPTSAANWENYILKGKQDEGMKEEQDE